MSSIQEALEQVAPIAAGRTGMPHGPAEQAALRHACEQFEGLLLGMILKESLRETFSESESDAAGGMAMLRDVCVEKMASSLAETSPMGLADQLVEDLGHGGKRHE